MKLETLQCQHFKHKEGNTPLVSVLLIKWKRNGKDEPIVSKSQTSRDFYLFRYVFWAGETLIFLKKKSSELSKSGYYD